MFDRFFNVKRDCHVEIVLQFKLMLNQSFTKFSGRVIKISTAEILLEMWIFSKIYPRGNSSNFQEFTFSVVNNADFGRISSNMNLIPTNNEIPYF